MKPLDPRLVRRSSTVRTHLVWSVLLGALTGLLIIGVSWCIAEVVARRFDGNEVLLFPLVIAAAFGLRAAIAWAHGVVSERAAIRVKAELRAEVVDDLLDPRRVGPRPESGRLVALLGPGMDAFDGYVGRFLPQLGLAAIVPASVIAVIAWVDPLSAVIIVVTLPLIGLFMWLVGVLTRDRVERRWAAMERLARHFTDVLDGLVVLKVFGRRQEQGIREVGGRHRVETMRALRLAFLSSLVLELISTISVALVAVSVGLRVVDGGLELRDAMFVLLLAPEAYLPVRRVGMMFHDSTEGATATAELLDLLDHDRHHGSVAPPAAPAPIVVSGARLTHPGRTAVSLAVDDLHVAPGEFVAVVGPSGGGKSTLLDVLLGFERLDEGEVTVGGTSLADLDVAAWRESIAWVPQTPHLVGGTIADNVALGQPGADRAEITAAARDAGLDLDLDRVVREGTTDLSAGERRRLAVARALLRVRRGGAWLVLLDEPTAGLDAHHEARVLDALRGSGGTVLVVTHRPESVAAADRVVEVAS
ncbi:thiol reductant ABC exporter subunit CydD [Aeromicrobium duanguangcaii]|uniref:Thiol reductant ABC exporter subunit CydD n=1 Tax=Aeromicrobium duanguangcaii TaxID=2968086 RepID=A0ABY5KHP1_9ACTN|nr:thiol reductant ABC exporter subunit CydD [Aeromicrobium duanguangcaii]MCD9152915.1 thiol reductant ABC exporter subunit CydD [Aeromicrobium duanguangcaii]UUI69979.1 thiol reductant ABC exporter subunit CydD [Aeromicrobium duanguangcaii]